MFAALRETKFALGAMLGVAAWVLSCPLYGGEPSAPKFESQDQRFLTQIARRTVEHYLATSEMLEPSYVPGALAEIRCPSVVTLRRHGRVVAAGVAAEAPLVESCRNAAYAAAETAVKTQGEGLGLLADVRIGIELIGTPLAIELPADMANPEALEKVIEPGLHGVTLTRDGRSASFMPSEIIYNNVKVADALLSIAQQLSIDTPTLAGVEVRRFRTREWWELTPGGSTAELTRGLRVVSIDELTRKGLDDAIHQLAEYMIYRQKSDGWFSYQYEPSIDHYSDDDSLVAQAEAAWALSLYARDTQRDTAVTASRGVIKRLMEKVTDLPGEPGLACVMPGNHQPTAGMAAMTCLAVVDHPDAAEFVDQRDRLTRGLLWLQRVDGSFLTAFPPARKLPSEIYFPGETLCALARVYHEQPQARIVGAFERGLPYYRQHFREQPFAPFVSWQMQAFARMAMETRRKDFADFVFEMADWLLPKQVLPENCAYPELWGGISAIEPTRVGITTAAHVPGLVEAARLAKKLGDNERARRYEQAIRWASRLVLQLQVRPDETYYMSSPRDALGGIRTSPSNNLLRIDHAQRAMSALMTARDLLFE